MNENQQKILNRSTGHNCLHLKLKRHEIFMLGIGMSEKDAKTVIKLLHIGAKSNRLKTKKKQNMRVCKLMYKYGYVLCLPNENI